MPAKGIKEKLRRSGNTFHHNGKYKSTGKTNAKNEANSKDAFVRPKNTSGYILKNEVHCDQWMSKLETINATHAEFNEIVKKHSLENLPVKGYRYYDDRFNHEAKKYMCTTVWYDTPDRCPYYYCKSFVNNTSNSNKSKKNKWKVTSSIYSTCLPGTSVSNIASKIPTSKTKVCKHRKATKINLIYDDDFDSFSEDSENEEDIHETEGHRSAPTLSDFLVKPNKCDLVQKMQYKVTETNPMFRTDDGNVAPDVVVIEALNQCYHEFKESTLNNDWGETFVCFVQKHQIDGRQLAQTYGSLYIEGLHGDFVLLTDFNVYAPKILVSPCDDDGLPCDTHVSVSVRVVGTHSNQKINPKEIETEGLLDISKLFDYLKLPLGRKQSTINRMHLDYVPKAKLAHDVHTLWEAVVRGFETKLLNNDATEDYVEVCLVCLQQTQLIRSLSCTHKVCQGCLTKHITDTINTSSVIINCPVKSCNKIVDFVSAFKSLNNSTILLYMSKLVTQFLSNSELVKRCPKSNCQTMAISNCTTSKKAFAAEIPVVECVCNHVWCFACRKPNHWPASCQASHSLHMLHRSEFGILYEPRSFQYIGEFLFKPCPGCHMLIYKEEGCSHMICMCGREFCWCCLGSQFNGEHRSARHQPEIRALRSRGSRTEVLQRRAIHYKIIGKQLPEENQENQQLLRLAKTCYSTLANFFAAFALAEHNVKMSTGLLKKVRALENQIALIKRRVQGKTHFCNVELKKVNQLLENFYLP